MGSAPKPRMFQKSHPAIESSGFSGASENLDLVSLGGFVDLF